MSSSKVWKKIWAITKSRKSSFIPTLSSWCSLLTGWTASPHPEDARGHWTPITASIIMRKTAVCDHYISISARTWVGGGFISLKGTMQTSALVPALTYAALTQPTAHCWACTTLWTRRRRLHPAASLRTWSPSPSSTMWVARPKWSSCPTWSSSPASAAKDSETHKTGHNSGAGSGGLDTYPCF